MRRAFLCFLIALAFPVLTGTATWGPAAEEPAERLKLYHASRPLAGTLFMVRCYAGGSSSGVERRVERAFDEAKRWEMILSERDARSELAQFNAAPWGEPVAVSPELEFALRLALDMARATEGRFDPTLGPLVRLWRRSARTGKAPEEEEIRRARDASGWRKLALSPGFALKTVPGMRLDLGGIGKGIMLDKMADSLRKEGISRFLLSDTSDFLAGAPPPESAGWNCYIGKEEILLNQEALSTSGGNYAHTRIGDRESTHVIDPQTGLGRTPAPAATVRAPTAAEADARATAAFGTQENGKK